MKSQSINNWKVLSDNVFRKFGRYYIKVKCTCGSNIEKDLPRHHLTSNLSKGCEKCSRFHTSKGYEMISGEFWALIKSGALKRNINFDISMEQAWDLYINQNKKCALSGLELIFEPNCVHNKKIDNRRKRTASLDRKDSTKSYTLDNVQWVHKDVNIMKNKYSQDYFIKICKLICKKN